MKKECESRFPDLPAVRKFATCEKCRFLFQARWDNNGYICANTCRAFEHPWCRESRDPVSKEDFEKVHIYIMNRKECLCDAGAEEPQPQPS